MKVTLFVIATLVSFTTAQIINAWIDETSCPPEDTEKVCSLKKKQCAPVNNIIKPSGEKGLVGLIRTCASLSGVPIRISFFLKVGVAYAHNNPESMMNELSADPKVSAAIRKCVLDASHLIGSDGKFNRTAAMEKLTQQPLGPNLVVPVFKGLLTCPEPENYETGPFLSCLRKACLASATAIFPTMASDAPLAGAPGSGMPGATTGMFGSAPGMGMGPGAGMGMGPGVGKMVPGGGTAPWASFIPSPGAFGGAAGPSSFGGASGPGAGGFGPGSFAGAFGGGSKAGPGAGGKWF